jgi:MFS family permease
MAEGDNTAVQRVGPFAPLRQPLFRRVWTASLFSNFGQLIQNVGAAWAMTELTDRADMVALVQTATFAPMIFISLPAGAIADSYDRRKVALAALTISLSGAAILSAVTLMGWLTPWLLLLCCALVGTGMALFSPAWQASVAEQVPTNTLPQAIALNSISYNIARSFGPAIGGFLVALFSVAAAFVVNAVAYIPMMLVMYLWRRKPEKSRLPAEAMGRAIISGVRFVIHSPPIRTVWLRLLLVGSIGSTINALMPLIAHDLLHGQAELFGILLGCYGVGAVLGALTIAPLREKLSDERTVAYALAIAGLCIVGVGLSRHAILTGGLLMVIGASWMVVMALCTISIQMSSPRWVTGRALAAFTTAICAGMSIGSWAWGHVAADYGTSFAIVTSGVLLILSIAAGLVLRMPEIVAQDSDDRTIADPDIRLELTGRSGPIALMIEYRVPMEKARDFYRTMLAVEPIRHRTGGYDWSLSRDAGDPELWVERYHTPTWHDYLRQRTRLTAGDMATWKHALTFCEGGAEVRIRRLLERPFGSVRWTDDVPDRGVTVQLPQGS